MRKYVAKLYFYALPKNFQVSLVVVRLYVAPRDQTGSAGCKVSILPNVLYLYFLNCKFLFAKSKSSYKCSAWILNILKWTISKRMNTLDHPQNSIFISLLLDLIY